MPLITRSGKGSPLTIEEMDGNFTYLESIAGQGGSGATPSLQDITDVSSITTNTLIIGSQSGIYSLLEDKSLLINYSDGITASNTNKGYFSVFNEWDGDNYFDVYYETYNGNNRMFYEIYAYDDQIYLEIDNEAVVNGRKSLVINTEGFKFGNGTYVTLNVDDIMSNYTLKLPNKSNGTYTIATNDSVISSVTNYYSTNSLSSYNQITIIGSTSSKNISLRNEDDFFRLNAFSNNSNSAFSIASFGLFAFVSGDNLKYASFDFSGNTDTLNTNYTMVNKSGRLPVINTTAPASATATGKTGEIRITSTFIYTCIADNTWVRASMASW